MKTSLKIYDLRAYMALIITLFFTIFTSCEPEDLTIKTSISSNSATEVKINTATLQAVVNPNSNKTNIEFEYRIVGETVWKIKTSDKTISGNDSVSVEVEIENLKANTLYEYRVKTRNNSGENIGKTLTFETYAVADFDGNLYHTVTIGDQTWLRENLRTTHYANGEPIVNITKQEAWGDLTIGAYCYYNNDSEMGKIYGALYNWKAVNNEKDLIIGWHVPTDKEWEKLILYLGGEKQAGPRVMENNYNRWKNLKISATNNSGFSVLPAGYRNANSGEFEGLGNSVYFWSSSPSLDTEVWIRRMYSMDSVFEKQSDGANPGFSVRCIAN